MTLSGVELAALAYKKDKLSTQPITWDPKKSNILKLFLEKAFEKIMKPKHVAKAHFPFLVTNWQGWRQIEPHIYR